MAWAKRTMGFSGADLAGLINEAAMAAAREGSSFVAERHLQAPLPLWKGIVKGMSRGHVLKSRRPMTRRSLGSLRGGISLLRS